MYISSTCFRIMAATAKPKARNPNEENEEEAQDGTGIPNLGTEDETVLPTAMTATLMMMMVQAIVKMTAIHQATTKNPTLSLNLDRLLGWTINNNESNLSSKERRTHQGNESPFLKENNKNHQFIEH